MVVRIRFKSGPQVTTKRRKNRHIALALATLLTPVALTALALSFWKLAADIGLSSQFAIREGLFSHWQVWLGTAILIQAGAILLNRYGNNEPLVKDAEGNTLFHSGL